MIDFNKVKALLDYDRSVQARLDEICAPLKLLGISNFSYTKITKDQKLLRLSTYAPYTDLWFKLELFNHPQNARGLAAPGTFEMEGQRRLYVWNTSDLVLSQFRLHVDMWNGANIYYTSKEYIEAWSFGGTPQDTNLPNFIVNNMDVLQRFMAYFRVSAKDIIDGSKPIDIQFAESISPSYESDLKALDDFMKLISTNKYLITKGSDEFYLTVREMECLLLRNQGLTAKETARRLNVSYRTVETYLNNIKIKSGMDNLNQILTVCRNEGIL